MALLVPSGTAAVNLDARYTARDDVSDVLMASLSNENNLLGYLTIGEPFAAMSLNWVEDTLNPFKVTMTSSIASVTSSTGAVTQTFSLSSSDASILDIGYILQADTLVGYPTSAGGDQLQVVSLAGTTVTVARNYGGASSASVASIASTTVLRIVGRPIYPNSDLGKDLSRARIAKTNYIYRFAADVNIDSEQIIRSQAGYVPGVRDELTYQFQQRVIEAKRIMSNALLYGESPTGPASTGTSPDVNYQTFYGIVAWLDGTANTSAVPTTTAQNFTDAVINTAVQNIYRQGGDSQIIDIGVNGAQDVGQFYQDRIRQEQEDIDRGFYARSFTPLLANKHYLVMDPYLQDTTGVGMMLVLDATRIRIRPFLNSFSYIIEAPNFRDGDAVRWISKWSLEMRNTGTDAGYSHQLVKNLTW